MKMAPDKIRDPLISSTQFPHRFGEPNEFAQLAMHIVENTYLNGETIRLDSGDANATKVNQLDFNAFVVSEKNDKFISEIKSIKQPKLEAGKVLISVKYSSLNYKDALFCIRK